MQKTGLANYSSFLVSFLGMKRVSPMDVITMGQSITNRVILEQACSWRMRRQSFAICFPQCLMTKQVYLGRPKTMLAVQKYSDQFKKNLAGSKTFLQCKKDNVKTFFKGQKYLDQYPPLLLRQPAPGCRKKEALHLPLFCLKQNQCLQTLEQCHFSINILGCPHLNNSRIIWTGIVCHHRHTIQQQIHGSMVPVEELASWSKDTARDKQLSR